MYIKIFPKLWQQNHAVPNKAEKAEWNFRM
jgi:hypothetical protein